MGRFLTGLRDALTGLVSRATGWLTPCSDGGYRRTAAVGGMYIVISLVLIGLMFSRYNIRYTSNDTTGLSDPEGIVLIAASADAMDVYSGDGRLLRTAVYESSNGSLMLKEFYVFRDIITEKRRREGATAVADIYGISGETLGQRVITYSGAVNYYTDSHGLTVREERYGGDGKLTGIIKYAYDKDGNLIKQADLGPDGKATAYYVLRWSSTGKQTEYITLDAGKRQISREELVYDADDRLSIRNYYDGSDALKEYVSLTYNKKGILTRESHYSSSGWLLYYRLFTLDGEGKPTGDHNDYNAAGQLVLGK